MKRGTNCLTHRHQYPVPIETHHVWPKEYGGPTVAWNLEDVCSNGHGDTHYYLNNLLKHRGVVPASIARHFGYKVQHLARRGWMLIDQHAPMLLPSLARIAEFRLIEDVVKVDPLVLHTAWRDFSVAYRGCAYGSHAPGEPHHYSCHMSED
jgi:hypothetical protein